MRRGWLNARAIGAGLLAAASATGALAAPKIGGEAADARVADVDGKALSVRSTRGRVLVVVYEDEDSGALNRAFKADLARLLQDPVAREAVLVAPVADVSAYDFWPAKGFAKDAIRAESQRTKLTIWCDWDGSFRDAFRLPAGTSSVFVVGRDGAVRFAFDGALDEALRGRALDVIRALARG
jgi:hypothetical protein